MHLLSLPARASGPRMGCAGALGELEAVPDDILRAALESGMVAWSAALATDIHAADLLLTWVALRPNMRPKPARFATKAGR